MTPKVSIIMGSTSDMKVMEAAAAFLDEMEIPYEINALSAHRVPEMVADFAKNAHRRGIRAIIAGAGGAAHLPGVIAAHTPVPVIGVPIKSSNSIDGWDSILSILQMPSGIPVATMALDGARNAAILAVQILAAGDEALMRKLIAFKQDLARKIERAGLTPPNVLFRQMVSRTSQNVFCILTTTESVFNSACSVGKFYVVESGIDERRRLCAVRVRDHVSPNNPQENVM